VNDGRVLEILARADAAANLPRLGGMARPQGVFITSEGRWAFASVAGTVADGAAPAGAQAIRRIPLARGLLRLAMALRPVFTRRAASAGRERLVFATVLALPVAFAFLPHLEATLLGALTTAVFLVWLFRGRTLNLHGAEHRAIAASERRELVATWTGNAQPSRFALRCGTNFAALAIPLTFLLQTSWPLANAIYTPVLLPLLSLGLAMELWQAVQSAPRNLALVLLAPGLGLQRLTTREPTLDETRTALRAVAAVLDAAIPAV
jgi:Protein of unknown function (DUF1385)